ncbi:MAG: Alanine dehydrogenase [Anaerolineae bacterium]|jgi:alanine dehydrogenase|nr:MAG: Alanine dehydrogenase [Anaerolineae bacterium]
MNIGVPKERRPFEFRVGLTPAGVQMLVEQGHNCYVEHEAGLAAGFVDQEYENAGARIVYSPHEVFGRADLLLKVARPTLEEINWLRPGSTVAGLLHLTSARQEKIEALLKSQITAIAFEQVTLPDGTMPIRRPLATIGGVMVPQIAARLLQTDAGGKGMLLGGVVGVPPAEVVIVGAGVTGTAATKGFVGMGAHVTVLDTNITALERLYDRFPAILTLISNPINLRRVLSYADVLVGAVLVPHQRSPIVITREMVKLMKPRSIIIDMSIDEGGCVETSRPTTHDRPTYIEEGVVHYCVPNVPSVIARTATYAYVNAAFPYIQELANKGIERAIEEDPALGIAVATHRGKTVHLSRLTPTA